MTQTREKWQTTSGREITAEVAEQLTTQSLRINAAVSADRFWKRVLTASDRKRLGGNLEECWYRLGAAGMWMKLRGVSAECAVIEVARELGFLDDRTAQWLLGEVGEKTTAASGTKSPTWHPESGELRLQDRVIRRIRVMASPSNIQRILDSFEAADWPSRIDGPLTHGTDPQRLHQAVLFLNEGLKAIRFHVQKGGQAVTWGLRLKSK
jgi:hypothetical protein